MLCSEASKKKRTAKRKSIFYGQAGGRVALFQAFLALIGLLLKAQNYVIMKVRNYSLRKVQSFVV